MAEPILPDSVTRHSGMTKSIDDALSGMRSAIPEPFGAIVDGVWHDRDVYVRWPRRPLLFMPESTRHERYHTYLPEQLGLLRERGIAADRRSNGPAIVSFQLAGGERPKRATGRGWTIHHIYDGQFPLPPNETSRRAVHDPELFTEAAGLVALHPIADSLAEEFAYFAWLLRREAFDRFGFDPDHVFE